MKIASITVYCNEDFRLDEWSNYVCEYIDSIYKHVIINNGFESDNTKLRKYFPKSHIIYCSSKSLVKAINSGIKFCLKDPLVKSILLIANDFTSSTKDLKNLNSFLYKYDFHMVSPIVFQKNSKKIEAIGQTVNFNNLKLYPNYRNQILENCKLGEYLIVDAVPGGFNLSKREFFEIAGLQDEMLHMYSDEVDTAIKAKKNNLKIAVNCKIFTFHQHTNNPGKNYRKPMNGYYVGRNEILLARKHFGFNVIIKTFLFRFFIGLKRIAGDVIRLRTIDHLKHSIHFLFGVFSSIFIRIRK